MSVLAVILMAACVLPIPNTGTSLRIFYSRPAGVFLFLLGLVGNPFSCQSFICAVLHGLGIIAIFLYAFFRFPSKKKVFAELRQVYIECPLIIMGGLVLGMFLIGRFRFGVGYSIASRYATFSILCNLGILCYVVSRIPAGHVIRKLIVAMLVAGIITGYYAAWSVQTVKTRALDEWTACLRVHRPPFDECNLEGFVLFTHEPGYVQRMLTLLYTNKLSFFHDKGVQE